MAIPKNQPLVLNQGSDWDYTVVWKGSDGQVVNLTGYSAKMQVRRRAVDTNPLIELSNSNNRIAMGGVSGFLIMSLSASETGALAPSDFDSPFVYDLEVTSGSGEVAKLLKGIFVNLQEVTRP